MKLIAILTVKFNETNSHKNLKIIEELRKKFKYEELRKITHEKITHENL